MNQKLANINRIILHCTDTPDTMSVDINLVKEWHLKRGFSDVGYHYLIRKNGDIEYGRSLTTVGAHTLGQNLNSIGIAYEGGWKEIDDRTCEQKDALGYVINSLKRVLPSKIDIHGHNEYSSEKACPNFNAYEEYNYEGVYEG